VVGGHHEPDEGQIIWGEGVTADTREGYRALFSAVFSDFYLFEQLLGIVTVDRDAHARTYLEKLGLAKKVLVEKGTLSTLALSQGQRKRLALLTAYLEDRPVYLFDEWAADQDPEFRAVFYDELLPELKKRGKTVIAITHDDRYFDRADRIVKLEEGRIVG